MRFVTKKFRVKDLDFSILFCVLFLMIGQPWTCHEQDAFAGNSVQSSADSEGDEQVQQALSLFENGKWQEARVKFQDLLQLRPGYRDAQYFLGAINQGMGVSEESSLAKLDSLIKAEREKEAIADQWMKRLEELPGVDQKGDALAASGKISAKKSESFQHLAVDAAMLEDGYTLGKEKNTLLSSMSEWEPARLKREVQGFYRNANASIKAGSLVHAHDQLYLLGIILKSNKLPESYRRKMLEKAEFLQGRFAHAFDLAQRKARGESQRTGSSGPTKSGRQVTRMNKDMIAQIEGIEKKQLARKEQKASRVRDFFNTDIYEATTSKDTLVQSVLKYQLNIGKYRSRLEKELMLEKSSFYKDGLRLYQSLNDMPARYIFQEIVKVDADYLQSQTILKLVNERLLKQHRGRQDRKPTQKGQPLESKSSEQNRIRDVQQEKQERKKTVSDYLDAFEKVSK